MESSYKNKFIKNIFFMGMTTILWPLILFVITILVAKYVGDEKFGEYSIATNYFNIFKDIAALGLPVLLIRELSGSKERASSYFINALIIAAVSATSCVILLNTISYLLGYTYSLRLLIFIFSLAIYFEVGLKYCDAGYLSANKTHVFAVITMVYLIYQLISTFIILHFGYSIYLLAINYSVLLLFVFAFSLGYLKKNIYSISFKQKSIKVIKGILIHVPTFSLLYIVEILIFRADLVILSKYFDHSVIGWYSVAKRFMFFIYILSICVANSAFPLLSEKKKEKGSIFDNMNHKIVLFIMILSISISLNLWILSKDIVLVIFGASYVKAGRILQIISITTFPLFLSAYMAKIIIVYNRQKYDLAMLFINLLILPFLYYFLIKFFGVTGAALSFASGFILIACSRVFLLRLCSGKAEKKSLEMILKVFILSVFMILSIVITNGFSIYFKVFVSNVLFGLLLFLLRIISVNDIRLLRSLIFGMIRKKGKMDEVKD